MQERIATLSEALGLLLAARPIVLADLLDSRNPCACVPGVYAISAPDDDEVLYVGRTKTLTILERMRDHCRGAAASDLKLILARHPDYSQQSRDYRVRWHAVPDAAERAKVELFAIAVLCPPFNRD